MNRKAFNALEPAQQRILRAAGRQALQPELARIQRDEQQALTVLCQRRKLAFASASPDDLTSLRQSV